MIWYSLMVECLARIERKRCGWMLTPGWMFDVALSGLLVDGAHGRTVARGHLRLSRGVHVLG